MARKYSDHADKSRRIENINTPQKTGKLANAGADIANRPSQPNIATHVRTLVLEPRLRSLWRLAVHAQGRVSSSPAPSAARPLSPAFGKHTPRDDGLFRHPAIFK